MKATRICKDSCQRATKLNARYNSSGNKTFAALGCVYLEEAIAADEEISELNMTMKNGNDIKSSEITDKKTYLNRRLFMRGAALAGTIAATGLIYRKLNLPPVELPKGEKIETVTATTNAVSNPGFPANEKPTSLEDITNYNNFYEFTTDKRGVASEAKGFVSKPWQVSVEGLVNKAKVFDLDELLKFQQEERVYRHRCVEGWSMVIPWVGFPLAKLLEQVEPQSSARYVAFETLYDPKRMPYPISSGLDWPYVEGLRLDEAMHPLAILATGLYGETLPPQDGAPIRLVVPWKYGFQEHQVDREDQTRRRSAADHLEPSGSQ